MTLFRLGGKRPSARRVRWTSWSATRAARPPRCRVRGAEEAWEAGFQTTFLSTACLVAATLPRMRERGWGRVIGVTCNTVAPGYTATERLQRPHSDPAEAKKRKARIPARRFGEPAEVGAAVAFLASNEAAYITGQEILVDGGWSI